MPDKEICPIPSSPCPSQTEGLPWHAQERNVYMPSDCQDDTLITNSDTSSHTNSEIKLNN